MCLFSTLEGKENNITVSTLRGKGSKMNLLTDTEVAQTPLKRSSRVSFLNTLENLIKLSRKLSIVNT